MPQALYILFGAVFTVLVSVAAGRVLLRASRITLTACEEDPIAFVAGSAVLSIVVFLLLTIGLGRKGIFLGVGVAVLAAAWRYGAHRRATARFPVMPALWRWLFAAVFAAFTFLYVANAMAPEISPDGVSYHLTFVARYLREHRLVFIPTNMYAQLSQGIEMLFAFAFAFG